jgi:nucleotide-binding universal stress UspA family protein
MPSILVAVDETDGSRRAAEFVDRFFAGMDVQITAVNVAQPPRGTASPAAYGSMHAWPWGPAVDVERQMLDEAALREEEQAEAVAVAQAPSGADVDVEIGDAVEAISQAAEELDADVIVVGTNDKGFLQRLFGGSVSEELARKAPCPVLVVR